MIPILIIHGGAISHVLACLCYGFAQLRSQELTFAFAALFFQLEADLLAINLIVMTGLVSTTCLKRALTEIERVVNLATQLGGRIEQLLFFAQKQIFTILGVFIVTSTLFPGPPLCCLNRCALGAIFRSSRSLLLFLMMEEATEDSIAGQDLA